jgi:hypothetical protein
VSISPAFINKCLQLSSTHWSPHLHLLCNIAHRYTNLDFQQGPSATRAAEITAAGEAGQTGNNPFVSFPPLLN